MNKIGIEKLVPTKYKSYADYVNGDKMLPYISDGLLPVQRRILLSLHLTAKGSYVKTAQVLGYCMGHFHPHSEADGTAAWAVDNEFADGGGQWGSKLGVEPIAPAAPRYTKIKINEEIENSAFKYIKSVPWVESELDDEPKYLPTLFPFCFMSKNELSSIAFGFRTTIPVYSKQDLLKRLEYILGERKSEPILKPIINGCNILSGNKDLKDLFTKGTSKLQIQGKFKIDKENNQIIIQGWSPRFKWEGILNRINRYKGYCLLEKGEVGFIDESSEKNGGTYIVFSVHRQRNFEETFNKLKEAIEVSLTSVISYNIYMVDDNKNIKLTPIDESLKLCHEKYKEAFKKYCETTIEQLNIKNSEYIIIQDIRSHLTECISKNMNVDKTAEYLSKLTKHDKKEIVNILEKYKINKLLTITLDASAIQIHIKNMKSKITNLNKEVLEEYKNVIL